MLRNLILSAALAIPLGAFLFPTTVAAAEPARFQFQVLVQTESGWQDRGTYPRHAEAREVAVCLWQDGYRVLIQEVVSVPEK